MDRSVRRDLERLALLLGVEPGNGLGDVEDRLESLYRRGALAKAHVLLQYTVAAYLYGLGYDVQVEYPLPGGLRADVYAEAPWEALVVEVETGRVPPRFLLEYDSYMRARLAYKALAYSRHSPTALAVPSYLEPYLPLQLLNPGPGGRRLLAGLITAYYSIDPHVLEDMLYSARLERIYLVGLDRDGIDIRVVDGMGESVGQAVLWI